MFCFLILSFSLLIIYTSYDTVHVLLFWPFLILRDCILYILVPLEPNNHQNIVDPQKLCVEYCKYFKLILKDVPLFPLKSFCAFSNLMPRMILFEKVQIQCFYFTSSSTFTHTMIITIRSQVCFHKTDYGTRPFHYTSET